jgi:RHS repeat-associated protein
VQYAYTATGQRLTVTDARGVTRYAYDSQDRLVSRTDPDGRTVVYAYDAQGNQTSVSVASGTTRYAFDALNRLVTVTAPNGGATRYFYDPAGNQVRAEFPNGTRESRSYDLLDRLVFVENKGPSGVLSSYRYTLGLTGLRLAVEEHDGRRVEYAYDGLYRLVRETITDATAGNRTIAYTHDAVGNRLTRNDSKEGTTSYTYDVNDRLLTETTGGVATRYTYDKNGNVLTRAVDGAGKVGYEWDAQNRFVGLDADGNGTMETRYFYDANGIRVARTTDGKETRYLIDSNREYAEVLEEYAPGGSATTSYVHGNDLIAETRSGQTLFHQVDGLGSTRALADGAGQIAGRSTFDAFGRTIGSSGATSVNRFAGEQLDVPSGLYYLRARYYDAGVGRFASTDPFVGYQRSPITLHDYLYANADAVNYVDPSGRAVNLTENAAANAVQKELINSAMVPARSIINIARTRVNDFFTRILRNKADDFIEELLEAATQAQRNELKNLARQEIKTFLRRFSDNRKQEIVREFRRLIERDANLGPQFQEFLRLL